MNAAHENREYRPVARANAWSLVATSVPMRRQRCVQFFVSSAPSLGRRAFRAWCRRAAPSAGAAPADADLPIGQNFLLQLLRDDRGGRAHPGTALALGLHFDSIDTAMLERSNASVDSQLFAAAERVTQWHRQRLSWRPISRPLPADREADAPIPPETPPAGQGHEPEAGAPTPPPSAA